MANIFLRQAGSIVGAIVEWKNLKAVSWAPTFRWDIKKQELFSFWNEGEPLRVPEVGPGELGGFDITNRIPEDWKAPIVIGAKLCLQVDGKFVTVWEGEAVYALTEPPTEAETMIGLVMLIMPMVVMAAIIPAVTGLIRK